MAEAGFGLTEGVIATLPGFVSKEEVVEVTFDPKVISYGDLVQRGLKEGWAEKVFTRSDAQHRVAEKIAGDRAARSDDLVRPDREPKYYLSKTLLRFVPMTGLQAARINGRIKDITHMDLLSPGQHRLLNIIETYPDEEWKSAIGKDLMTAWEAAEITAEKVSRRSSR